MERVIALLREKNEYLEKFYAVNEHELINLGDNNFENVEAFYQARDKILELIRYVDELIADESQRQPQSIITAQHRADVEAILKDRDQLVNAILAQDLQIIEYVEKEKSSIIRELRAAQQARRAVGAYANTERRAHLDEKP